MKSLTRLIQDEEGVISYKGQFIEKYKLKIVGKLTTLLIKNPCLDIQSEIDELTEIDSFLIPKNANSYISSEFNPDTQHTRLSGNYSVYALQFYYLENN